MTKVDFNFRWICVRLFLIAVVSVLSTSAQTLQLDPTFDTDGKLTIDFGSSVARNSFAIHVFAQPSGRIVAHGIHVTGGVQGTAACGLTPSGGLDSGFGSGGRSLQMDETLVRNIEPLSNGQFLRLVFLNFASSAALTRHNLDGSIDNSFLADLTTNVGPASPLSITTRPDGKILVVLMEFNLSERVWMLRLNADGSRDPSFGTNGASILNLDRVRPFSLHRIHVLPDNRILLGGYSSTPGGPQGGNVAWAALLDQNGHLDRRFGLQGIFRHRFPYSIAVRDTLLQPDGKIILLGYVRPVKNAQPMMIRLTPRGRRDVSFGINGIAIAPNIITGSHDILHTAQLMSDGRILAAGSHAQSIFQESSFLIERFSASGQLENFAVTPFTPNFDSVVLDMFIQPDGKPVAVGYTRNPDPPANGTMFAIARYTQ